jgi:hypothetical protein
LTSLADQLDASTRMSSAHAISVLQDSELARETVVRIFRTQFGLPEEPWVPGAAVPFDADAARAIAALRKLAGSEAFAQGVRRLLAPR